MDSGRAQRTVQHRLDVSAEGLREVGGVGLPVGAAHSGEVWTGGSGIVVLGGVERAGYRLLARHDRGIRQALRLRGSGSEACAAVGEGGRSGYYGAIGAAGGRILEAVFGALRGR